MEQLLGFSDPRIVDNWKAVHLNCMGFHLSARAPCRHSRPDINQCMVILPTSRFNDSLRVELGSPPWKLTMLTPITNKGGILRIEWLSLHSNTLCISTVSPFFQRCLWPMALPAFSLTRDAHPCLQRHCYVTGPTVALISKITTAAAMILVCRDHSTVIWLGDPTTPSAALGKEWPLLYVSNIF